MQWLLSEGQRLVLPGLSAELTVRQGLGSGTQGQVYAVDYGAQTLALKWYFPSTLELDPELGKRLAHAISSGSPSAHFLWPQALAGDPQSPTNGLGYLMQLRPAAYVPAQDHMAGRMQLDLQTALSFAFELAEAFHALHSLGLCYKDISLGNVFLNPHLASILICDNDNVTVDGKGETVVLGTPGFMAPEILRGEQLPCAGTDLFSLAVLIFRLLTRHDPFRGCQELALSCLDAGNLKRLYGDAPVFIFDPEDNSNRPDPQHHLGVLLSWPIYPEVLRSCFVQTFVKGLRHPQLRTLTGEWKRVLAKCLDQRLICQACNQEAFPALASTGRCWSCGAPLPAVPQLVAGHGVEVTLSPGNRLHRHHLQPEEGESLNAPLGMCVSHPSEPQRVGLQNCSDQCWQVELCDGSQRSLAPGAHIDTSRLKRVLTPWGVARVVRPA